MPQSINMRLYEIGWGSYAPLLVQPCFARAISHFVVGNRTELARDRLQDFKFRLHFWVAFDGGHVAEQGQCQRESLAPGNLNLRPA